MESSYNLIATVLVMATAIRKYLSEKCIMKNSNAITYFIHIHNPQDGVTDRLNNVDCQVWLMTSLALFHLSLHYILMEFQSHDLQVGS